MRTLPKKISFEPFSLLKITQRKNKDILEFLLVEFEIYLSIPTLYSYLLTKVMGRKDPIEEINSLYDVFGVIECSPKLLAKMAEIESILLKKGILIPFDDLMIVASSILEDSLLIVDDEILEKYSLFIKYGLRLMSYGEFLEKVEELIKEEEAKIESKGLKTKP